MMLNYSQSINSISSDTLPVTCTTHTHTCIHKCAIANSVYNSAYVLWESMFKCNIIRLHTNGQNQIDYVTVNSCYRNMIGQLKGCPGTDCGSDHVLVMAVVILRLKALKKSKSSNKP